MNREETTRMRRELGLDLIEASRKAGVTLSSRPPTRVESETCKHEADQSLSLQLMDLDKSK